MFRKKDTTPRGASVVTGTTAGTRPRPTIASAPARSVPAAKPLQGASKGKQAYEARRAEKAGMGLDKWMAEKDRRVQTERDAVLRVQQKAVAKKPGLLRRLLDRAHRPI